VPNEVGVSVFDVLGGLFLLDHYFAKAVQIQLPLERGKFGCLEVLRQDLVLKPAHVSYNDAGIVIRPGKGLCAARLLHHFIQLHNEAGGFPTTKVARIEALHLRFVKLIYYY
jgi:hypothetical protein